ncbi:RNA ligase family protein [Larkinella humicola]|uniref:2'-5' RNA ligase n=1 Tax=Larkinella humicola TaxID=2607654 RepID=A0A5N1JEQ3_9BACT|nr:RNA ligase family protein [Larkinella humicola]KAA9352796.1 2'-5' RNA ligase [Larkinella humicola]
MVFSQKYGRTYHYPFSPGTTSDDRINQHYEEHIAPIPALVHTEKLDGENNCLNRYGVFARSHAAPTQSPWTRYLRDRWELIRHHLGDLELFGENLYAIHSIEYRQLEHHFYVFAIRDRDCWLSWEETRFYAQLLDFPVVPELEVVQAPFRPGVIEKQVKGWANQNSRLGSHDALTGQPCTMEGIVTRNTDAYTADAFGQNVFKYVRAGHVKTDEHWTRNWKRASLLRERPADVPPQPTIR